MHHDIPIFLQDKTSDTNGVNLSSEDGDHFHLVICLRRLKALSQMLTLPISGDMTELLAELLVNETNWQALESPILIEALRNFTHMLVSNLLDILASNDTVSEVSTLLTQSRLPGNDAMGCKLETLTT